MVRLKVLGRILKPKDYSFQFHYGTIKSLQTLTEAASYSVFQFHYGTIKSYMRFETDGNIQISIPLWYD